MNIENTKKALATTIKSYIAISIVERTKDVSVGQSKFGGFPYLPENFEYPKTAKGNYLYLLAQINFAEIPELEGFPKTGILQFYIANDDLYGLDFENQFDQDGFRVLYFPDLDLSDAVTDFSFLPLNDVDYLPIGLDLNKSLTLSFVKQTAPISHGDYKFEDYTTSEFIEFIFKNEDTLAQYRGDGHKIGGYPWFMQSDPREFLPELDEPYILLLQIDSDDYVTWGDAGVGNFFIRESDLKNLDFSNVMYNWDCC